MKAAWLSPSTMVVQASPRKNPALAQSARLRAARCAIQAKTTVMTNATSQGTA